MLHKYFIKEIGYVHHCNGLEHTEIELHISNFKKPFMIHCRSEELSAIQFRRTISETQRLLRQDVRTKRCVELSPSVAKPAPKLQETESPRRRSLDFIILILLVGGNQSENARENESSNTLLLHVSIYYSCRDSCVLVEYTALLMSLLMRI